MNAQDRIRDAVARHGLHRMTSELLKQSGEPYPVEWNLKTAALAVTLKMARNRQIERSIGQGLVSLMKVVG